MEDMHRVAPGIDWKKIDQETCRGKIKDKLTSRADMVKNGLFDSHSVTFANGSITGQWEEKGSDNQVGRIMTADVDTNTNLIYAGSDGGNIWVGDINGGNWTSINDFLKINNIVFLKKMNDRLIVLQRNPAALYITDDDGLTWSLASGLDSINDWGYFLRGIVTTDNIIYLLGVEWDYTNWHAITTIFKSTDLGNSFTQIHSFDGKGESLDIYCHRYGPAEIFFVNGNNLYSLDSNDQLNLITTFNVSININTVTLTSLTGGHTSGASFFRILYVSGSSYIYGSDDDGVSWNYRGSIPQTPFLSRRSAFNSSIRNPDLVYMGGLECWRSHDAGLNWQKVNTWRSYYGDPASKLHADIPAIDIFIDPQNNEYNLVSTDGGIYISYDSLLTVQNLSLSGLRISQYYSTYSNRQNPEIIFAGSQDQGFQRALDDPGGIIDFEQTISGDYGHIVSGNNGNSIWTVYPGFVMIYPNAGTSTTNATLYWSGSNFLWMPPLMEDPLNPNGVFLGGGGYSGGAKLWHLTYNGSTLTPVELNTDFSDGNSDAKVSAMAYSPLNNNFRYILNSEGIFYYSSDAGANWTKTLSFTGPASHYFYGSSIVASPTDSGRVYIGGSGYSNPSVYVSDNHGETFTAMDNGLPSTLVYQLAISDDGELLFAATHVGPYVYVDSLGIWEDIAGVTGPDQIYWSLDYIPSINTARFATYGRGIWDFEIQQPTSIPDQDYSPSVPENFNLSNYPNPFNPATTIEYQLPEKTMVELKIYNSIGQEIKTLVNNIQTAGGKTVIWNGRNNLNHPVNSGIYIYRIRIGSQSLSKKMLLIR